MKTKKGKRPFPDTPNHSPDELQVSRANLANIFVTCIAALDFIMGILVTIFSNQPYLFYASLLLVLPAMVVPFLNRAGKYDLAAMIAILTFGLSILFFGIMIGPGTYAEALFFLSGALILQLLPARSCRIVAAIFTGILFLGLLVNYQGSYLAPLSLSPQNATWLKYCFLTAVTGFNVMMLYLFNRNEIRYQVLLEGMVACRTDALRAQMEDKDKQVRSLDRKMRSILTPVVEISQALAKDAGKSPFRQVCTTWETAKALGSSSDAMIQLLDNLLDQSLIENEALPGPVFHSIRLKEFLSKTLNSNTYTAAVKNIRLQGSYIDGLPETVLCDERMLCRLMHNLFTCAVDFAQSGSVITMSLDFRDHKLIIVVQAEDGFGTLRQLQNHTSPLHPPGGYGTIDASCLVIANAYATALGGNVRAFAIEPESICLTAEIPVRITAPSLAEVQAGGIYAEALKGTTALIVDDDRIIHTVVDRQLKRTGMKLLPAYDGTAAFRLAREHYPSIILLDLQLPDVRGLDLLRTFQHDDLLRKVPILIISSTGSAESIQAAMSGGASGYLTKPFYENQLPYSIGKILSDLRNN